MSRLTKVCRDLWTTNKGFYLTPPRWLFAREKETEGDDALQRLIDADENDERFLLAKQDIMISIQLEREQTKRLTFKVLFTGDGSPTKNVRRIW